LKIPSGYYGRDDLLKNHKKRLPQQTCQIPFLPHPLYVTLTYGLLIPKLKSTPCTSGTCPPTFIRVHYTYKNDTTKTPIIE